MSLFGFRPAVPEASGRGLRERGGAERLFTITDSLAVIKGCFRLFVG